MTTQNLTECDHDLVSSAVDGELNDVERAWFDSHLAVCSECREEYLEMWSASKLCSGLPDVSPPPDLVSEIRSKLVRNCPDKQDETTIPSRWWNELSLNPLRLSFASGFSFALVALVLVWIFAPSRDTSIAGFTLVAQAEEEVAGLDLVFEFDPLSIDLEEINLAEISQGFLMQANTNNGILRVSMASPEGIRIDVTESILDVPVKFNDLVARGSLTLRSARAYRTDGKEVAVNFKTIPMSPASIGGKDTAA